MEILCKIGDYFIVGFILFITIGIPIIFILDALTGFSGFDLKRLPFRKH